MRGFRPIAWLLLATLCAGCSDSASVKDKTGQDGGNSGKQSGSSASSQKVTYDQLERGTYEHEQFRINMPKWLIENGHHIETGNDGVIVKGGGFGRHVQQLDIEAGKLMKGFNELSECANYYRMAYNASEGWQTTEVEPTTFADGTTGVMFSAVREQQGKPAMVFQLFRASDDSQWLWTVKGVLLARNLEINPGDAACDSLLSDLRSFAVK